ncbi:MAG: hypothetical protein U5K79_25680 [Cyclobacteriaceae bacterium]|nr:hypothetical protein [Cyclobacteriaceae bacterium]
MFSTAFNAWDLDYALEWAKTPRRTISAGIGSRKHSFLTKPNSLAELRAQHVDSRRPPASIFMAAGK